MVKEATRGNNIVNFSKDPSIGELQLQESRRSNTKSGHNGKEKQRVGKY